MPPRQLSQGFVRHLGFVETPFWLELFGATAQHGELGEQLCIACPLPLQLSLESRRSLRSHLACRPAFLHGLLELL